MKRKVLPMLCLGIFLWIPAVAGAECTDIGPFTGFALDGENTVILYYVNSPVVRFDVQSCNIQPSSSIQILQGYMCDGDQVMIDGSKCVVMEIKPLGP